MLTLWTEDSEAAAVGAAIAPAGIPWMRMAIGAKRAGDEPNVLRYAAAALASDTYANEELAAGRIAKRFNIIGNAWTFFYEVITGRPSPIAQLAACREDRGT